MSRIYEALKRAESERTSAQRERTARSHPSTDTAVAEAVAPLPLRETRAPFPEHGAENGKPSAIAESVDPTLFDSAAIPRRKWNLDLTQLPALQDRGAAVEQFRSLRSRMYEFRDQARLKSILVSSGLPQEGKSFIAANLAISLARHKKSRVLLIDGDMRRSTLHKVLGCEPHPGLVEYLAGKATLQEVMQKMEWMQDAQTPRNEALANLTFIGGGDNGDQAADLSGSRRFQELLTAVAPSFDWIVVDSSPVIPVSDAVNLARACDGVLLVARGGVTQFTVAQRAQSELKASKILGFVLNAVKDAPAAEGYYGYNANEA